MIIEFYPSPTKWTFPGKKKKENTDNVILLDPPENKTEAVDTLTKPAGPITFSPWQYQQAQRKLISVEEFVRRNNIVIAEAGRCNVAAGQVAYPRAKSYYETYGACKIVGVVNSYADMNETGDKWPPSDLPKIILATPLKAGVHPINTTSTFFQANPPK